MSYKPTYGYASGSGEDVSPGAFTAAVFGHATPEQPITAHHPGELALGDGERRLNIWPPDGPDKHQRVARFLIDMLDTPEAREAAAAAGLSLEITGD